VKTIERDKPVCLLPGTGDDDPGALEPAVSRGDCKRHGHFRPGVERRGTAKFDAVSVDTTDFGG